MRLHHVALYTARRVQRPCSSQSLNLHHAEQSVTIPEQSAPTPAAWIPPAANSPTALAYCTTARRVRMHRKRPCKICTWRNAVLPDPDSPVSDCHTPMNEMHESDRSDLNIALMADMHTKPNQKRMEVLSTQKLEAGCFIAGHDGRKWFRLPTRSMCPLARTPTNAVRQCLQQEGRKSMLEDDASANVEPSSHPKARSRIPPAPAASSQHVAEADGLPPLQLLQLFQLLQLLSSSTSSCSNTQSRPCSSCTHGAHKSQRWEQRQIPPPSYGLDIPWDHKLDIFRSRSICESCQKSGTNFLKIFCTHVPTS